MLFLATAGQNPSRVSEWKNWYPNELGRVLDVNSNVLWASVQSAPEPAGVSMRKKWIFMLMLPKGPQAKAANDHGSNGSEDCNPSIKKPPGLPPKQNLVKKAQWHSPRLLTIFWQQETWCPFVALWIGIRMKHACCCCSQVLHPSGEIEFSSTSGNL